jgi:large subunit ribosomal protein L25
MAETLNVQLREDLGKRRTRRLRKAGSVPAILYGHGEKTVSLAIPAAEVSAALRHGSRLVDLKGAVADKAFIRDLQWDTYGLEILHLDLARISEHELVKVTVPLEFRGEAPGVKQGGIVEHMLHDLQIECPVSAIPERLTVSLGTLKLGDSLTVADLIVPQGIKVLTHADVVVTHCVEPVEEEEVAPVTEGAEPEVIGRKAEEEEEEG